MYKTFFKKTLLKINRGFKLLKSKFSNVWREAFLLFWQKQPTLLSLITL